MKLYGIKVLEIFQEELELGNFFNIYIYIKRLSRRKKEEDDGKGKYYTHV
jgi:hypothetical protein